MMSRDFFATSLLFVAFLLWSTMALGADGDKPVQPDVTISAVPDETQVQPEQLNALMGKLNDPDINVRKEAMTALYDTERETLKKNSAQLLPALEKYASRWDGDGERAVLLIGDLGDNSRTLFLHRLRSRAFELYGQEDQRAQWSEAIQKATLKALFKLYDNKATISIQNALPVSDETATITLNERALSSRTLAIECVAFAQRKDFLFPLVLLLDDTINLIPNTFAEPPPRIRDMAARAIMMVSGISPDALFQQEGTTLPAPGYRFSDEEITRLRELLKAAQEATSPTVDPSVKETGQDIPPPVEPIETSVEPIVEVIPIEPPVGVALPSMSALAPPLGLTDVEILLSDTIALLRDNTTTDTLKEHQNQASERTILASAYLDHLVQTTAGHVQYQWIFFEKETVIPGENISREFGSGDIVENVMAVRFHANDRGSVFLRSMIVRDSAEQEEQYEIGKLARGDIPKHEVVYLDHPTNVESIVVTMQNPGNNRRRMYMDLGVPNQPEYARELACLCRDTLIAIRANQPLLAAQIADQALVLLREFQIALSEGIGRQ